METEVTRRYKPEFLEPIWVRKTTAEAEIKGAATKLGWWRGCSGLGVDDPHAIFLDVDTLVTLTCHRERTLSEALVTGRLPSSEVVARSLGAQVCLGLLRVHSGLETYHGALNPFNVRLSDDGQASLWSVPTARLEMSGNAYTFREVPGYASQEQASKFYFLTAPEGAGPPHRSGRDGDITAVGHLLNLICEGDDRDCSTDLLEIISRCMSPEKANRFSDVASLARALDSNSEVPSLDLARATNSRRLAERAFESEALSEAREHFEDAQRHDWLDPANFNNLAVLKMYRSDWDEAEALLEKAYGLTLSRPTLIANFAFIALKQGRLEEAEFWSVAALELNPFRVLPYLILAEVSLARGGFRQAREILASPMRLKPCCGQAYALMARAHEKSGNFREAAAFRENALKLGSGTPFLENLMRLDDPPPWEKVQSGFPPEDDPDAPPKGRRGPRGGPGPPDFGAGVPRRPGPPRPVRKMGLKRKKEY